MAGVQQIEAAVGESDAQALPPPVGEMIVEQRPVEHDLLLGRERRCRQNARAQFGDRQSRGAAFSHHHRRRGIGRAHGGFEIGAHRQHGGDHRHHRVAGAGNIAHAHRIGRNVDGRALAHQRHAGLAARHQYRLRPELAAEFGRRRRDLLVGLRRRVGRIGEFLPVRRDHGGAAIDAVVAAFRIDNHRLAEFVRGIDDGADEARGERALGVIGQHHRAGARHRLDGVADQRVLAGRIDGRGHFPIGAQHVGGVMLRHKADLARGLPRRVDHQMEFDQRMGGQCIAQRAAGLVVADHADENTARAEPDQIARHVAGAADHHLGALDRDHRRRRFRRNARHLAVDEFVQHQIADAEHGLLGQVCKMFVEVEHLYLRSFPRIARRTASVRSPKRESRVTNAGADLFGHWVPACAGTNG